MSTNTDRKGREALAMLAREPTFLLFLTTFLVPGLAPSINRLDPLLPGSPNESPDHLTHFAWHLVSGYSKNTNLTIL